MLDPDRPDFKVGDHVWVVVDGSYVFERPVRIRNICERDGQAWAFVEGSEAGAPVDSLTAATDADTAQSALDPGAAFAPEELEHPAEPQCAPTVLLPDPVEAGKGGEGGVFQITNAEFIAAVFTDLPEGAFAAVCSKPGNPKQGGWRARRADDRVPTIVVAEHNNYLNCSSFYPGDDGSFNARKAQFAACHFLMLDDLGTKVPLDRLGGFELSWRIETSPGNYQGGILFDEPVTEGTVAARLLNALIDAELCDAGSTQPLSRWARLPVAINGKPNYTDEAGAPFQCRLVEWQPDKRYSPQDIVDQLQLELARGRPFADKPSSSPDPDAKPAGDNSELMALLEASRTPGQWHNSIRDAIASMIGRGWPNSAIKVACAPYCKDGADDPDLVPLIEGAREKWDKPDEELAARGADITRLNKTYAVLPIGGKTRVVKFGELEEFPGRETIVMTQTIPDFASLLNKYRHTYRDKKGELQTIPLGTYWINSPKRRQYDGGMAFMPQREGDVGNRLNLFRGFGVQAVKPEGASGAAGCQKFLHFMRVIICSDNEAHFDYLLKREATIFQKRIRSEIALGLQTREEGCGKGFYEATMGRLLGTHAMQVTNPRHIIGNFNPHLETLLRLTADEALFVGNPEHRNALFGLITEPTLTIEPKGCGLYKADSYLNLSITSNADHFLPVSWTARRFLIPTVSAARKQDFTYFAGLKAELEDGGYEALLYHLLYEVDLTDFNVRLVPQTEGLMQQRDHSLPPLEAWWCELLETGTLWGADPREPHRAVSNAYQRLVRVELNSSNGDTSSQIRPVRQLGIHDQARELEPRLKKDHTSDHRLGAHLKEMGCDNTTRVLRRRGWTFPPLPECRAAWIKRYPNWKWRNPEIMEWHAEESDDVEETGHSDDEEDAAF